MDIALVIRGFGSDRAVESVVRHILIMPEPYTFQEEALDDFVKVETLDGNNQVPLHHGVGSMLMFAVVLL